MIRMAPFLALIVLLAFEAHAEIEVNIYLSLKRNAPYDRYNWYTSLWYQ